MLAPSMSERANGAAQATTSTRSALRPKPKAEPFAMRREKRKKRSSVQSTPSGGPPAAMSSVSSGAELRRKVGGLVGGASGPAWASLGLGCGCGVWHFCRVCCEEVWAWNCLGLLLVLVLPELEWPWPACAGGSQPFFPDMSETLT